MQVVPERFAGWCERFAERHGALTEPPRLVAGAQDGTSDEAVVLTAADGSVATCGVPFPPLAQPGIERTSASDDLTESDDLIGRLIAHALVPRTVGVLMVRRGGFAVGVFDGDDVVGSKAGSRHVQGRSKAGGWSQQRFARRREGQAREAYAAAADYAFKILVPHASRLDALILGGDAGAISALRTDPRLRPIWAKEAGPFLNVGDPKAHDLHTAPDRYRSVRIRLVEAEGTSMSDRP